MHYQAAQTLTRSIVMQAQDTIASINKLCLVFILVMVLEGMVVVPLAVAYMYYLLRDMCRERASLFTVFLRIPRPTVVAIVKQKIRVGDADEDDEDAGVEDQVSRTSMWQSWGTVSEVCDNADDIGCLSCLFALQKIQQLLRHSGMCLYPAVPVLCNPGLHGPMMQGA